jgi:WD40 repeat protein
MNLEELLNFVDKFIYTKTGNWLKDIEVLIIRGSYEGKNYNEIAEDGNYTSKYLRQDVGPKLWSLLSETFGEKVSKTNFRSTLERHYRDDDRSANLANFGAGDLNLYRDWGEVVDVPNFYGREQNFAILKQWIVTDRCQTILLLGMGGIGKTSLSIKVAQQIQHEFKYVIWRSLRNTPPLEELLTELISFVSNQQEIVLPEFLEQQVSLLLHYLQQQRCLILLDNVDSIIQAGVYAGSYLPAYEGYGYLFDRLGRIEHQSCLFLTSREKPKEITLLEGDVAGVRSLHLGGLNRFAGQELFKSKGCYAARDEDLQEVSEHYDGNPLALKIVASAVQELVEGDMTVVLPQLKQGRFQFDDINDILERQWNRLSAAEQQVMYWLAINREPVSVSELQADIVSESGSQKLLGSFQSLVRRSLIDRCDNKRWTLQPVVMEYVTCHLIEAVSAEITAQKYNFLNDYALLKAQSKDYIRKIQVRLILRLVIDRLSETVGRHQQIEQCLKELLIKVRSEVPKQPGYIGGNILNLLAELNSNLSNLDCSDLTIWQAYLVETDLHNTNFANTDLSRSVFIDTLSETLSVTFSPNGKFLATSGTNGRIFVWEISTDRPFSIHKGHTSWICSVAFNPSAQILASASFDQTIKLWDVNSSHCLRTLQGHKDWVYAVSFSHNGEVLVSSSADCTIKLWEVSTGHCLKTLQGHTKLVSSIVFSSDGRTLASGSHDRTIKIWDVSTGQCLKTLQGHTHWVWSVALSPNCDTLLSGSEDQTIKLWDINTGQCLKTFQGHRKEVLPVSFSPCGKIFASGSEDQTIKLWDINTGQCLKTFQGHASRIWSVAFSPNGQTLASGSEDKTVRVWDVNTGQCLKIQKGYFNWVREVTYSSDGQTLASGNEDKTVRVWDVNTGQCLKTLQGHINRVSSVAFSPDDSVVASGSEDRTIKIWDVNTGQCLKTLQGHTGWLWSVTFSPDGGVVASGSEDRTIKIWDVNTSQCLKTLQGHTDWLWSVTFSPDGSVIASGSEDRTIKIWDVTTGQCLKTLQGHINRVWSVAFSPDGSVIASGSDDRTIKIWDVNTSQCLKTLQGHTDWVLSVAFSPDGSMVASGSEDRTIKIWDVNTSQCLKTLQGHTGCVSSVAFSLNSPVVASGSQDGTIKTWDINVDTSIKTLRAARPYEGMNIKGVLGLTEAQKDSLKELGAVEVA